MNAVEVELRAEERHWPRLATEVTDPAAERSRGHEWLPRLAGVMLFAGDVSVVSAAFGLAAVLRFSVQDSLPAVDLLEYARLSVMVGVLTSCLAGTHGLFDLQRPRGWATRLQGIASSLSTALVISVASTYFLGEGVFSRAWFATGWLIALAALALWRGLARRMYTRVRAAVAPANRVLIVGANRLGQEVAKELQSEYEVVGCVDNGSDLEAQADLPLLGPISQLDQIVQDYAVNEVVITLPGNRREQVKRIVDRAFHRPVTVKYLHELSDVLPEKFHIQEFGGRRYIGFAPTPAVSWAKRATDLILTGAGVLLISPVLLVLAIAIKLDSPGPVFYRQRRAGKNGQHFSMYKFRSMCQDADRRLESLRDKNEATGPLFKMREDPRITRIGRFIRRWSLDELPQLFNVLRGEMSLVGPRPPLPSEVAEYEDWQLGRLRAVPGLTGLWQVSGRSEVPFYDMVRLDLHYIRNWSLGLDFEILLRTIPAVLTNRGAY